MALGFFFIGLILVISAIKGTHSQLASLLASEFTGAGNFWLFIAGIVFLGSLGYIPALRNTSRGLIALTLIVLLLSNGGFWQKLTDAVSNPERIAADTTPGVPDPVDVSDAGKKVAAGIASQVGQLAAGSAIGGPAGAGLGKAIGIIGALF